MKTQISRLSPALHAPWSGVYHQQGRMIADADWNALSEIAKARLDHALRDEIDQPQRQSADHEAPLQRVTECPGHRCRARFIRQSG